MAVNSTHKEIEANGDTPGHTGGRQFPGCLELQRWAGLAGWWAGVSKHALVSNRQRHCGKKHPRTGTEEDRRSISRLPLCCGKLTSSSVRDSSGPDLVYTGGVTLPALVHGFHVGAAGAAQERFCSHRASGAPREQGY